MNPIETETDLEEALSRPTPGVLDTLSSIPGDIMVLGAGGKMGPTLARMLQRASDQVPGARRIFAVSRFSNVEIAERLRSQNVYPIACDLTDRAAINRLPNVPNIIYMTGQKFGTADQPELTWVMNILVPAFVAERFCQSRIVAFSTGCVYPFVAVNGPGSVEADPLTPVGEYANSCVGRERVFAHFSNQNQTPVLLFRLNYAIDLRYGVLHDIAQKVYHGLDLDLSMGWVNVIWQGDANARAIQCLGFTATPATVLNVTGRERLSVRELALRFGRQFGREPRFVGCEGSTALLSDASRSFDLFGPPTVSLDEMIAATAHWVSHGGRSLGKPTHFETRDGNY